jgi:radical SAM superfamily enzyme
VWSLEGDNLKPQVIIFQGTTHDPYWYNRAAGGYKLATYLDSNNVACQVIPNCTALTLEGFRQVFRKYGSDRLLWIGFTTNWLAGRRGNDYYQQWQTSMQPIINTTLIDWFHTEVDQRDEVYKCIYTPEMFQHILNVAHNSSPDVQLVFGGSQLNRNEYFHHNVIFPQGTAHFIKGNAEEAVLTMTKRFVKGNYTVKDLPSNDEYDYGKFKTSFIQYKDTDNIQPNEWLPIEISRGCAFKCKFCNYDMKGVTNNYVDAKVLRKNIIQQYERFGTTKFTIMDDLYNDNYAKVKDLYDNCWSKLPFQPELAGYLRLDLLWKRPDQAQLLLDSGFRCGSFGIETLHDKAGKAVGKGLGRQRIVETLQMCHEIWRDNILVHAFFIAGLPHEDQESLIQTIKWTKDTKFIHGIIWHWLELENIKILPPDTNVDKISILGKDPEKYGYTWDPDTILQEKSDTLRIASADALSEKVDMPENQWMEKKWKIDEIKEQAYNTNWVNDAGVDLNFAKYINKVGNNVKLNTYFTMYADKRALGFRHHEIIQQTIFNDGETHIEWENTVKKPATIERLLAIIS